MIAVSPPAGARTERRADLELSEWDEAGPDSHPDVLRGLALDDDPGTRAAVQRLSRQGVVDIVELRGGIRVTTTSYVGRVAVGPLEISILPKVAWERWLGLFSYGLRLRGLVRTEEVAARLSTTSLHDLIVLELFAEARDLIGGGLHREYVRRWKDLTAPRGRIDFMRLARRGGIREASVPCRYTRRSHDFHLNRVLLAGLLLARRLATDVQLRADVGRLAHRLGGIVDAVELTAEAVRDAHGGLDRRTRRYASALELIDLLRRGVLVSMERPAEGEVIALRGFALDMNVLWQRLLLRMLREWLPDVEVKEEYGLSDLLRPDPRTRLEAGDGRSPDPTTRSSAVGDRSPISTRSTVTSGRRAYRGTCSTSWPCTPRPTRPRRRRSSTRQCTRTLPRSASGSTIRGMTRYAGRWR